MFLAGFGRREFRLKAHQVLAQPGGLHTEAVAFLPQGCRLRGRGLQQEADGLGPVLLREQVLAQARYLLPRPQLLLVFGSHPVEPGVEGGAVASTGVLFRFDQGVRRGLASVVLSLRVERVLGRSEGLARRLVPAKRSSWSACRRLCSPRASSSRAWTRSWRMTASS